jgi:hypothetical protein
LKKQKRCKKKGIHNIFSKIITENFPIRRKLYSSKTPNRLDQNRTTPWHIIIKQQWQKTEKECWRL